MSDAHDASWVRLDREKLHCLAHPMRSRLLAALRTDGPSTSAKLARRLGTNTGASSYHLRELADVGLVHEVQDMGTARERWWAPSHHMTSFSEAGFADDPDDRAAVDWLMTHHLRATTRWREEWLAARHTWTEEWVRASNTSDHLLELTPAQLASLNADLEAVVERYRPEGPAEEGDVQQVLVLVDGFPAREVSL